MPTAMPQAARRVSSTQQHAGIPSRGNTHFLVLLRIQRSSCELSSRYRGQLKSDYFQVQGANFKYVLVVSATQSTVAKAFTVSQSRPVGKIRCLDRLPPLPLDAPNPQNPSSPPPHKQLILSP